MADKQTPVNQDLLNRVRLHAYERLSLGSRETTNLYLEQRVQRPNEYIGPPRQEIKADRPSILVFADDLPRANFEHPCRYLLYDAKTGEHYREVAAKYPPFTKERSKTLVAFHEPVRFAEPATTAFCRWPPFRCPFIFPKGKRYAILYSGMSNTRHLNDLEFLYRTLIDLYHFDPANIYGLSYDGTLRTQEGVQTHWPGDGTNYRIHITGDGTRASLDAAIDDLKGKLKQDDLLLIHTNNHGDWDGSAGTANICTYPSYAGYYANDFATKLGTLPKFNKLIVMMEQCHAGGFNNPIITHSTANATSVASAATEPNVSWGSADGHWDCFARDWIAAQAGHDPYGAALSPNPDADGDGRIEAEEAYDYGNAVHYSGDSPNYSESSEAGGDVTLGQEYRFWWWWWWCDIWHRIFYPIYVKLPPEEYLRVVRDFQPQLSKLVTTLNDQATALNKDYTKQLETLAKSMTEKRK